MKPLLTMSDAHALVSPSEARMFPTKRGPRGISAVAPTPGLKHMRNRMPRMPKPAVLGPAPPVAPRPPFKKGGKPHKAEGGQTRQHYTYALTGKLPGGG